MYGDKLGSALDLGTTRPGPSVPVIVALLAEFVLTAVLLIVVMSTAVYQRSPGGAMPAGLAIGLWIYIVGPRLCRGRRLGLAVPQAGPPARRSGTTSRAPGPGGGRSTARRRRSGKVLNT